MPVRDDRPDRDDETTLTGRVQDIPAPSEAAAGEAIVVVLHPPQLNPGRRFPLPDGEIIIGRRSDADLQLDVESVSRRHASILRKADGWWVRDLQSMNGTFIEDEEITEHRLRDGDVVRFGEACVKFLTGANVEHGYHEEIYRLSILDGLTGVHNRRFFDECLEREVARSMRRGTPLALVVFDIDLFKNVNDQHGHLAGDAVLQGLCRRLKTRIRREDLLARTGGEEFACILSDTTREGAVQFAEDLRQMVAREAYLYDSAPIWITISLGVAVLALDGHSLGEVTAAGASSAPRARELMRLADEKLYVAKNAGRNQVAG